MKSAIRLLATTICISAASAVMVGTPASATDARPTTLARYGDHWIDMANDWESAKACTVGADGAFCFATERQLDAYLSSSTTAVASGVSIAAACSSSLRLYDGVTYTGAILHLTTQWTIHNLSSYGFDNRTSSYKVGACSSLFYSGASGGGSLYPTGNTQAFDQFASMLTGWNNVLSSVYIN
jgi:hypothetical protein